MPQKYRSHDLLIFLFFFEVQNYVRNDFSIVRGWLTVACSLCLL